MLMNKLLKLWKWMGFANVFIGCSLFDIYVKDGNKKIWHEMITFVCDSKSYARMSKYNIVSIFMWFSGMIFHKAQMYATHIVVITEVGVECMCSTLKCNHSWSMLNLQGHWTSLMLEILFVSNSQCWWMC